MDNLNNNRDKLYEFDSVGRLMKAHGGLAAGATGVTANWTQTYTYDRYGNKTATSVSGDLEDTTRAPRDGLSSVSVNTATNRVNTSGWEYDLSGNLIRGKDGTAWQKFEYDAAGRLVKIRNDSNVLLEEYTYGASRARLKVETSSQRRYFAWGGQNVAAEYIETGSGTTPEYSKAYIHAGSRLFMTATKASSTTETKEFHHPDRLGTQLVTEGSTGSSFRQSTMPFGTAISTETTGNTNQVFTSYDRSGTTGLDYAVNRTYSKGQSRFTQVDPIGILSSSRANPQSNNLYAYVQNIPTEFVDPSGLNAAPIHFYCYDLITYINGPNGRYAVATTVCNFSGGGASGGSTSGGGYVETGGGGGGGPTESEGDKCTIVVYISGISISSNRSASSSSKGSPAPKGQVGTFNHIYITYSDSSTGQTVGVRAGPDENDKLFATFGEYRQGVGFPDFEIDPQGAAVEQFDGNCDAFAKNFQDTVKKVNDAKITYAATGNNSNAFAYTALLRAGFDANSLTPRLNGFLGNTGFVPGWGVTLPLP